jgi:hypothetical protein
MIPEAPVNGMCGGCVLPPRIVEGDVAGLSAASTSRVRVETTSRLRGAGGESRFASGQFRHLIAIPDGSRTIGTTRQVHSVATVGTGGTI